MLIQQKTLEVQCGRQSVFFQVYKMWTTGEKWSRAGLNVTAGRIIGAVVPAATAPQKTADARPTRAPRLKHTLCPHLQPSPRRKSNTPGSPRDYQISQSIALTILLPKSMGEP